MDASLRAEWATRRNKDLPSFTFFATPSLILHVTKANSSKFQTSSSGSSLPIAAWIAASQL